MVDLPEPIPPVNPIFKGIDVKVSRRDAEIEKGKMKLVDTLSRFTFFNLLINDLHLVSSHETTALGLLFAF